MTLDSKTLEWPQDLSHTLDSDGAFRLACALALTRLVYPIIDTRPDLLPDGFTLPQGMKPAGLLPAFYKKLKDVKDPNAFSAPPAFLDLNFAFSGVDERILSAEDQFTSRFCYRAWWDFFNRAVFQLIRNSRYILDLWPENDSKSGGGSLPFSPDVLVDPSASIDIPEDDEEAAKLKAWEILGGKNGRYCAYGPATLRNVSFENFFWNSYNASDTSLWDGFTYWDRDTAYWDGDFHKPVDWHDRLLYRRAFVNVKLDADRHRSSLQARFTACGLPHWLDLPGDTSTLSDGTGFTWRDLMAACVSGDARVNCWHSKTRPLYADKYKYWDKFEYNGRVGVHPESSARKPRLIEVNPSTPWPGRTSPDYPPSSWSNYLAGRGLTPTEFPYQGYVALMSVLHWLEEHTIGYDASDGIVLSPAITHIQTTRTVTKNGRLNISEGVYDDNGNISKSSPLFSSDGIVIPLDTDHDTTDTETYTSSEIGCDFASGIESEAIGASLIASENLFGFAYDRTSRTFSNLEGTAAAAFRQILFTKEEMERATDATLKAAFDNFNAELQRDAFKRTSFYVSVSCGASAETMTTEPRPSADDEFFSQYLTPHTWNAREKETLYLWEQKYLRFARARRDGDAEDVKLSGSARSLAVTPHNLHLSRNPGVVLRNDILSRAPSLLRELTAFRSENDIRDFTAGALPDKLKVRLFLPDLDDVILPSASYGRVDSYWYEVHMPELLGDETAYIPAFGLLDFSVVNGLPFRKVDFRVTVSLRPELVDAPGIESNTASVGVDFASVAPLLIVKYRNSTFL